MACFIEFSESGGGQSVRLASQDLQQREAIVDRTMPLMKISRLANQVSELDTFVSPRRPVYLGVGTSLGLTGKEVRKRLAEWSVETGIVGDKQISRFNQRL